MSEFPKFLVVDDDPGIRRLLSEMLSLDGYQSELAVNGREALDLLQDGIPRVILLDLLMPIVDGRGVIESLNAIPDERIKHVIVLISALVNLEQNNDLGADYALGKPFNLSQLSVVLQHAMRIYESRRRSRELESRAEVPTIKLAKRLSSVQDEQVGSSSATDEASPKRLQTIDEDSDNTENGVKDDPSQVDAIEISIHAQPSLECEPASAESPRDLFELASPSSTSAVDFERALGDSDTTPEQQGGSELAHTLTSFRKKRRRWLWW